MLTRGGVVVSDDGDLEIDDIRTVSDYMQAQWNADREIRIARLAKCTFDIDQCGTQNYYIAANMVNLQPLAVTTNPRPAASHFGSGIIPIASRLYRTFLL